MTQTWRRRRVGGFPQLQPAASGPRRLKLPVGAIRDCPKDTKPDQEKMNLRVDRNRTGNGRRKMVEIAPEVGHVLRKWVEFAPELTKFAKRGRARTRFGQVRQKLVEVVPKLPKFPQTWPQSRQN